MLQSQLFCKTQKKAPNDAKVISHQYLLRADFIEQSFSGVYRFLPLGFKVLKKIEGVIREEMLNLGAQEVYLAALQNKSLWLETGRWQTIDPPLFKLKDRHQKEIGLGATHEEEIVDSFRRRMKSYQDLPLYIFQIQDKFRNEMRATGGLLRTREFLMKDLYSFHRDKKDGTNFYKKVKQSYFKIFKRCGLKPLCVEANPGTIGGELSHEFMVPSAVGEDRIFICQKCGFAANIEKTGSINKCPKCHSQLLQKRAIEIGHIFNLGTKYSEVMKADYLDKNGKSHAVVMGCYGIGLERLMATIVEIHHDEKGIIWPREIAPFAVHLIQVSSGAKAERRWRRGRSPLRAENNQKVKKAALKLYHDLEKSGIEVLYDDRINKTVGEKFAEADLIGLPIRLVVSEKTLNKNSAELKKRSGQKIQLIKLNRVKFYVK